MTSDVKRATLGEEMRRGVMDAVCHRRFVTPDQRIEMSTSIGLAHRVLLDLAMTYPEWPEDYPDERD